ncbi:MAG: CRP-like cAMP-binding protein [Chitinophagales bacterium]|jgi:CRP-like cAMP-binding protein
MDNISDIINLDSKAKHKVYKKGEVLQTEGKSNAQAFYVKSGLLRTYTIDEKGKEHVFMFAPEGWIIADLESFEFNQPAKLFIDCMENSEVVIFERTLLGNLNLNKQQLSKNIQLLSRRVAVLQRRVIMLMSATAKQRYEFFIETYPELTNRVSQRMIASFVGITPEALSKIRGEIAKSK